MVHDPTPQTGENSAIATSPSMAENVASPVDRRRMTAEQAAVAGRRLRMAASHFASRAPKMTASSQHVLHILEDRRTRIGELTFSEARVLERWAMELQVAGQPNRHPDRVDSPVHYSLSTTSSSDVTTIAESQRRANEYRDETRDRHARRIGTTVPTIDSIRNGNGNTK